MKNIYIERKQLGLCVECGGEKEEDRKQYTTCQTCKEKRSLKAKNLKYKRINSGLCPECGKNKLVGEERNCSECREKSNEYYKKKKEKNVCMSCGKTKDREGCYCSVCLEKKNAEWRESRKLMICIGICPNCKKNMILGDERQCPECRAKEANRISIIRAENREEYNKKNNDYSKKHYDERKKNGLCPRCGKKPDDTRYKMCSRCRNAKSEQRRIKCGTTDRSNRAEKGICYFCDNPVKKGYKVCEKHYQMNIDKLQCDAVKENREKLKKMYG